MTQYPAPDCSRVDARTKKEAAMTARSILLVDDDDDLRETLVEQLSLYEEFAISQESSATKGVQAARSEHVDLLIMDVGLPDMDGARR
jgi:DNA-binding response OmpR family regulator